MKNQKWGSGTRGKCVTRPECVINVGESKTCLDLTLQSHPLTFCDEPKFKQDGYRIDEFILEEVLIEDPLEKCYSHRFFYDDLFHH
jgi:hypothetical protein